MKNWFIVQTFSGFEQKVAETLKDLIKKKTSVKLQRGYNVILTGVKKKSLDHLVLKQNLKTILQ